MTYTYDLSTAIGQVRLLCRDNVEADAVFTDAEIQAYLTMEGSSVKKAAAQALDDIASSETQILEITSKMGVSSTPAAIAADLRARAKELRRQAEEEDGADFDFAETDWESLP